MTYEIATQEPDTEIAEGTGEAAEVQGGQLTGLERTILENQVVEAIRTVYDPEIPINIYELGLIYQITVEPDAHVHVLMTLTSPGCPVAGSLPGEVEQKVISVPGVSDAHVEVTWEPAWNMDMMTDEAKLELGLL